MNKRDALRLQPGDIIIYGDSMMAAKFTWCREGRVVHVTQRGGIKVRRIAQVDGGDVMVTCAPALEWVPYHHVRTVDYSPRSQQAIEGRH